MCGIVGIFPQSRVETPSEHLLTQMIHTIAHRGPDAQKVWSVQGMGLAHARLSIIDLDAAADQPMFDAETGCVLVFNGEIYNYIELKQELTALGHCFKTKSDTEVILKAYAEWGEQCLNKFNGMWAIAVYDPRQQTLFCARDRLGVKPFIYGITSKNTLVFASEAKAITAHFPEFQRANKDFLLQFVEQDFFACYQDTFYQNMFHIMPGHYFVMKHGELPRQQRYWRWSPSIDPYLKSDASVCERFKALLTDSVRLRFRSDVPVGACLSGGMDSSTIVGLARQLFDKRLHTFSCVFPHTPAFDESKYIQASAERFDTIAHYVEPSHDDFIALVQASIYEQDGPTGGPSILSQRAVMELAGQNVKVILDGQGADELLGGYHGYFHHSLLTYARRLAHRKTIHNWYQYFWNAQKIRKRLGAKTYCLGNMLNLARTPVQFYTSNERAMPLNDMTVFQHDDLNTILLEHVLTNLTNLLHYEDRNSMRFSVESRLPFLDYRLVEFVFSLPHRYKIRGSTTKWLLHHVAKPLLPKSVLQRKDKMGFTTPAHQWFLERDNLQFFKQYLQESNPLYMQISPWMREHLNQAFLLLEQHQASSPMVGDMNGLWRFFTASMWNAERS